MQILALIQALLLATVAAAPRAAAAPKNVFGADDRIDTDPASGALLSVLRLDGGCTAVLAAPRLALTAAHCLFDENGATRPPSFVARGNFRNGMAATRVDVARAWYGTKTPNHERTRDWAILELQTAPVGLGDGLRIDLDQIRGAALPLAVTLAGFSGDRRGGTVLTVHRDCALRAVDRDGLRLFHDCDAKSGISGAPLLARRDGESVILGLTVSEFRQGASDSVERDAYSDDFANVGVAAASFAAPLAALVAAVGAGEPAPELAGVFTVENPRGAQPDLGRVEDYQWRLIRTFSGTMPHGANAFDFAFEVDLPYNRVKLAFAPAGCTRVRDVKVAAITRPETNAWEEARTFDGVAAALARGDFRFLRLAWHNDGFVQACELALYGALGDDGPELEPAPSRANHWYCAAAPGGDFQGSYHYWWLAVSLDVARYQALTYCTQNYGYSCLVGCRAYD